jgi:hypothetical protein
LTPYAPQIFRHPSGPTFLGGAIIEGIGCGKRKVLAHFAQPTLKGSLATSKVIEFSWEFMMLSFLRVLMGFNELQWDLMGLRLGFSSENQPTGCECILKWDSRQHLLAINGIRIIIIIVII